MNIEEERKAFEADLTKRFPGVSLAFSHGRYWNTHVESALQGWLAAKAHAEEMAKPEVVIMRKGRNAAPTGYAFNLCLFEGDVFNGVLEDFRTREDAEEWAKDNGYRVVSE